MALARFHSGAVSTALLLATVACGGSDGLTVEPGEQGAGGQTGAGSGSDTSTSSGPSGVGSTTTTVGSTTVTSTGAGSVTVGAGGTGSVTVAGSVTVGTGGTSMTTGGTGGASSGGAGGGQPACIPGRSVGCICVNGAMGAQVCRGDGTYGDCVCDETWEQQQLARLRRGIVGTWDGLQTNPWNSGCPMTITFEANGQYSAHSPGESCIVFYYGSNQDSAEKTYLLNDVLPTAEGQGEIVFWFAPGDTNPGELRHVVLSDDENVLHFEAWKTGYGPLVFDLKRVSRLE